MAYSKDIRMRALELLKIQTEQSVSEILFIGVRTLSRWKLEARGGKYESDYGYERKRSIDRDKIESYISNNPDAYLREIAVANDVKLGTLYSSLQVWGITRKKRHQNIKNAVKRSGQNI